MEKVSKRVTQDGETWIWGKRKSSRHEMLEKRPWIPREISTKICFCAKDANKCSVVRGEQQIPFYDDVYDLEDYERKPLYITRD